MFAALAVASCSAMAAINSTVADLQFAKKSLEYATKTVSFSYEGTNYESAVESAAAHLAGLVSTIESNKVNGLEFDPSMFSIESYKEQFKDDVFKGKLKVTLPALDKNGLKTKVVTTKLNGVMVITNPETPEAIFQTVLWDNTKNVNKPYKYWGVPVDAAIVGGVKTADGKASLSIAIGDLQGVATGTVDKNTKKIKSVAGNFADLVNAGYGTWKYANNKKLVGKTLNEVLTEKKVELVK